MTNTKLGNVQMVFKTELVWQACVKAGCGLCVDGACCILTL